MCSPSRHGEECPSRAISPHRSLAFRQRSRHRASLPGLQAVPGGTEVRPKALRRVVCPAWGRYTRPAWRCGCSKSCPLGRPRRCVEKYARRRMNNTASDGASQPCRSFGRSHRGTLSGPAALCRDPDRHRVLRASSRRSPRSGPRRPGGEPRRTPERIRRPDRAHRGRHADRRRAASFLRSQVTQQRVEARSRKATGAPTQLIRDRKARRSVTRRRTWPGVFPERLSRLP